MFGRDINFRLLNWMAKHTDFSVAAIGWLATDYPFHRHLQGAVYLEPNVSKSDLQPRLAKH